MTQDQAKDTTPITKSIFSRFFPVFKHQAKFGFDFGWMECTETIFKTCPSIIVGRSIPLGLPIGLWLWTRFYVGMDMAGWCWSLMGMYSLNDFHSGAFCCCKAKAVKRHWLWQSFPWPCFCDAPRLCAGDLLQPPQQMRPAPQPSARTSHCQWCGRALGCCGAHCATGEAAISASRAGWRWEGIRWLVFLSTPMLVGRITAWQKKHKT